MDNFELRRICSDLLNDLNIVSNRKNMVKLGIDIQLPDLYYGNPGIFLDTIKKICQYFADNLVNGIIAIEVSLRHRNGPDVILTVEISVNGLSSCENEAKAAVEGLFDKDEIVIIVRRAVSEEVIIEFTCRFPSVELETGHEKLPFNNKRILLVEDNEINALVFASFLEEWGCRNTIAANGMEAIGMAHDSNFDTILMDLFMPIIDGNQAIKKIREFNKTVPIIALTASTSEQDLSDAVEAGANDYLLKPVSSGHLFKMLSKYL